MIPDEPPDEPDARALLAGLAEHVQVDTYVSVLRWIDAVPMTVGPDGRQCSALKVLDTASHVANLVDSAMHCVYVVEVSDPLPGIDVGAMPTKAANTASSLLETLVGPYGISQPNVHIPVGKVGRGVQRVVDEIDADLLVIGTAANKELTGALLGNSVERILTRRLATCW
ncbi:MAG: universal stress protein [Gammaproteobacteria bacterium]|nr:universal stress protein [Gammaproteobacteria bacterium]